jgi:hypothetical protein
LSLHSGNCFFSCAEAFKIDATPLVNSCSYFPCNYNPIQKTIVCVCIFHGYHYVFLWQFQSFWFCIKIFDSFWIYFHTGWGITVQFLLCIILAPFPKTRCWSCMDLFLDLLFCFIGLNVCFWASTMLFLLLQFWSIIWSLVWYGDTSSIAPFAQDYFCYSESFMLSYEFFSICEKWHCDFDGNYRESVDCFQLIIILPIHEHGRSIHILVFCIDLQGFVVFTSLVKLISRYFINFEAIVNGIVFLNFISACSLLEYR